MQPSFMKSKIRPFVSYMYVSRLVFSFTFSNHRSSTLLFLEWCTSQSKYDSIQIVHLVEHNPSEYITAHCWKNCTDFSKIKQWGWYLYHFLSIVWKCIAVTHMHRSIWLLKVNLNIYMLQQEVTLLNIVSSLVNMKFGCVLLRCSGSRRKFWLR